MKCDAFKSQFTDYVYEELSQEDRQRFEQHLAKCAACRSEVATLRCSHDWVDMAAQAARQTESAEIDTRVVLDRHTELARLSRRRWRRAALLATAATVLLALAHFLTLRLEVHSTHFSVTWGAVVQDEGAPASSQHVGTVLEQTVKHERHLDELDQLLRLVVDEINSDNEVLEPRMLALFVQLDQQLTEVKRQNDSRWETTKHLIRNWQPTNTVAWQSSAIGDGE